MTNNKSVGAHFTKVTKSYWQKAHTRAPWVFLSG